MKTKPLIILSLILGLGISASGIILAKSGQDISAYQSAELSPISIYDEKNLLDLSMEDVGKYHGDICLCATVAFRTTQLAISQLWNNEIPRRGDFEIISALPTQGSQDCFEFITRAKRRGDFTLKLPGGTNIKNLSRDNWTFTFIRKSTGERVRIQLKEEIFSGGSKEFFNLRKKVEFNGTATAEEKEMFASSKQKIKKLFMSLPADKLFIFEKKKRTE